MKIKGNKKGEKELKKIVKNYELSLNLESIEILDQLEQTNAFEIKITPDQEIYGLIASASLTPKIDPDFQCQDCDLYLVASSYFTKMTSGGYIDLEDYILIHSYKDNGLVEYYEDPLLEDQVIMITDDESTWVPLSKFNTEDPNDKIVLDFMHY